MGRIIDLTYQSDKGIAYPFVIEESEGKQLATCELSDGGINAIGDSVEDLIGPDGIPDAVATWEDK